MFSGPRTIDIAIFDDGQFEEMETFRKESFLQEHY